MQPRRMVESAIVVAVGFGALLLITMLFITPSTAAQPGVCPVTPAPVAYWQLDETETDTRPPYVDFFDANPIRECRGTNCPTPAPGKIAGGQRFDGLNDGLNIINPEDNLFDWAVDDSFSIALWMKGVPGETCSDDREVLIGRDDPLSSLRWWIGCRNDAQTPGGAYFQLRDASGVDVNVGEIELSRQINDGEWHHVVGVYDGSEIRLYVDAATPLSKAATFPVTSTLSANVPVNLGWLNLTSGFEYAGTLDEVALYDTALTAGQVQQLYDNSVDGAYNYCTLPPPLAITVASVLPDAQYVYAGETVTQTYQVENSGGDSLNDVNVQNTTCDTLTPMDVTLNAGATADFTCEFTASDTVTNPPTTITSSASAVSGSFETEPVTYTLTIIESGIELLKTASTSTVTQGQSITYSYSVTNTGNITLTEVMVQDACVTTRMLNTPLAAQDTWSFDCTATLNEDTDGAATATGMDPRETMQSSSDTAPVDTIPEPDPGPEEFTIYMPFTRK